tara:strand:- start:2257 stop:2424 length:168 start_codon:yes stop_codon:yes gene_type:complete
VSIIAVINKIHPVEKEVVINWKTAQPNNKAVTPTMGMSNTRPIDFNLPVKSTILS